MRDLFPARETPLERDLTYDYVDERGERLFQVVRFATRDGKKDFRQRRPDGSGGWIWKLDGVRRVLYHLPDLTGKEAIFVVEGEKDADRLRSIGLPATTNAGGAGKWRDEYSKSLKAAGVQRVAILADHDAPGEAHARAVGQSCHEAGLFAKVILLPDLPPKGDVSDWLDAGRTKQELLDIVRQAPPFNPQQSVAAPLKQALTSLGDLLAEPENAVDWLIEDRLPVAGIALLAGPPKGGKSTMARYMTLAVATGGRFVDWRTSQGAVWYLALEEKRSELRRHFRQMGATGSEPIRLFVQEAPEDMIPQLHALAQEERPALIVVDTLQRLLRVKDMSDYAEVTERFNPLLRLARETGAALLGLHHTNKYAEGLKSVLGSTALAGSVDQVFLLTRTDSHRTFSTIQRIGQDLEPIVITMDSETGRLASSGSKQDADDAAAAERIIEALDDQTEAVTERWIENHVEGRGQTRVRALRLLLRLGQVRRCGRGGSGDPYRYALTSNLDTARVMFPVPEVPTYVREQEEPGTGTSNHRVSSVPSIPPVPDVPKVPQVPEVPEDADSLCFEENARG